MAGTIVHELSGAELIPFIPLLSEIECGEHFDEENEAHVEWLKHKLRAHLAAGTRYYGCRSQAGQMIGVLGLRVDHKLFCAPTAEVVDIGIVSTQRHRGLGSELLQHALKLARADDAHCVYARTYAGDTGTIAFYGQCAFYPVAIVPGTNGPDDCGTIVMMHRLNEASPKTTHKEA